MPTVRDFASKVVDRIRIRAIREGAASYKDVLASIKAEDVAVLIAANRPLRDILPRRIVMHPLATKIINEDPSILLEILEEYNPKLAKVLSTPAGRAWWSGNRR